MFGAGNNTEGNEKKLFLKEVSPFLLRDNTPIVKCVKWVNFKCTA